MSKSYVITYAGQYESTLASCGAPINETVYPTWQAAMMDIARVWPGDTKTVFAEMEAVEGAEGYYVYRNEEDAENDQDGSIAIAVIEEAPAAELTVTLTGDGMGEESDEADYDAWVAYVTDRLSIDGVEITVDALPFGHGGSTRTKANAAANAKGDVEQDVRDQLVALWDAFCADDSAWPAREESECTTI